MATKADIIAELLRGGLSNAEAAERVGCSVDYVRAVRSRRGLPGQTRYTEEQRAQLYAQRYERWKEYQRNRYRTDPEFRKLQIERSKQSQARKRARKLGAVVSP